MAVLTGNYVTLAIGGPGYATETKDFVLVRSVDTTDFMTQADRKRVAPINNQTANSIVYQLTGNKAKNAKNLMVSLGLDRQYDIHGRIPKYKTFKGTDPTQIKTGDTELKFLEIPLGVEPDYFEEEVSKGHIFRDVSTNLSAYDDAGKWAMVTNYEWNPEIQYYLCQESGNWYSLISASDETPQENFLMFYLGRGILDYYENREISEYVLQTPRNDAGSENYGWWMYGTWTDGSPVITALVPTNGYEYLRQTKVNTLADTSYFDGSLNGYRNVGSTITYYQSQWKVDATGQETWKNLCVNTLEIQNLTITQFGTLTDDGHTYFGIWVVEPELKNYIGYSAVTGNDNPVYSGTDPTDLRRYGNFTNSASRTDFDFSRITFYGIELSELNIVPPIKDGPVPPPVNPYVPQGKDWPKLDPVYLNGRSTGLLSDASSTGYHVYRGTTASLKELQKLLWNWGSMSDNIEQNFNDSNGKFNPLALLTYSWRIADGVIRSANESRVDPLAAIQFIHNLPGFCNDWTGTGSSIKIAGIDTGIPVYCLTQDVVPWSVTINCDQLASTESYLDLSPWSTAEIYIPYIGTIQLDPADIIGGRIEIKFNCCVTTGVISAHLLCYNALAPGYVAEYGPYIGDAKYSIPIAQKDQNAFNRELGYVKAIGTAMGGMVAGLGNSVKTLATANSLNDVTKGGLRSTAIMGAGSLLSAKQFIDSYLMKQQFRGTELGSGSAIVCPTQSIYVMYTTPLPAYSDFTDSKRRGLTSGKIKTVALCKQEGQKTLVKFNYIDLSTINATQAEIDAIQTYMLGGVYV